MEERLFRIATAEIRQQSLVALRVTLLGPALVAAGAVAAFLAIAWSRRGRIDLAFGCAVVAAVIGSAGMLIFDPQPGLGLTGDQGQVLPRIGVLTVLGCLCAAGFALVRPPGPHWLSVVLVTALLLFTAPVASAYAAAPAGLLNEAPAFERWLQSEGAPVLIVLNACENSATDVPAPSQATELAGLTSEAINTVRPSRWRSDGFRRATTHLRASLTSCRDGALVASAGKSAAAKSKFMHALCLSGEFTYYLTGLEGRPAEKVRAIKLVCPSL